MRKIFSIAYYTFLECVRNKVLLTLLVFLIVGTASANFFRYLTAAEDIKLLKDFSLGAITFIGIVISIFLPISVISLEMEKLTIYAVLSKPVKRSEFILAKYLGVMLTMLVMLGLMGGVFLGILYAREGSVDFSVLNAVFLLFFKFAVVSAVSVFFNIITTSHVFAILVSFFIYILGHLTDYMEDIIEHIDSVSSQVVMNMALKVIPDLSSFDISDALAAGVKVSACYSLKLAVYSAIYSAVMIVLAIFCFQKRDL